MTFMILILEDRAVYNIERVIQKIKAADLVKNRRIQELCNKLIQKKTNPAKMGVIGQYIYKRNKMITTEEQCKLADVCEIYDSVVSLMDNRLRKLARKRVEEITEVSDPYLSIAADLIMCIICTDIVEVYYRNYQCKRDYIRPTFRGHDIGSRPFAIATTLLDELAFEVIGKKFTFDMWDEFDNAYKGYVNTIVNNERLMKHYKDLGITDKAPIRSSDPKIQMFVKYTNNSLTNNK